VAKYVVGQAVKYAMRFGLHVASIVEVELDATVTRVTTRTVDIEAPVQGQAALRRRLAINSSDLRSA
jgi:hypothetical protein